MPRFSLAFPGSSPCNHARATFHSRVTVRGEMRSTSAVLLHRQPSEKAQFDHPSLARIDLLQRFKSIVQLGQFS